MTRNSWDLGYEGFIEHYMIAGPSSVPFAMLEKKDRPSFKLWYEHGANMVDFSGFYSSPGYIEFQAKAVLIVGEEDTMQQKIDQTAKHEVDAFLWTYMECEVFLNGEKICESTKAQYKPIKKVTMKLTLKLGENELLVLCKNRCERDTRNIFGVQIIGGDGIKIGATDEFFEAVRFMDALEVRRTEENSHCICCVDDGASYNTDFENITAVTGAWDRDFEKKLYSNNLRWSTEGIYLPSGTTNVTVFLKNDMFDMKRNFEIRENIMKAYLETCEEDSFKAYMRRTAEFKSLNRGEFGFSVMNVLARKALEIEDPKDDERLMEDLKLIEERVDCADFLICGILRLVKNYDVAESFRDELKKTLLGFRYWITMDGDDGMCFWSENHTLMFYSSAMFAGQAYPEAFFTTAKMTGAELFEFGRGRVYEWLDDVEKFGFEEFLSSVYLCVTLAALLNLIDFAESDISARAEKICDKMLRQMCRQAFAGSLVSPMGRVYRNVLYPFADGAQAFLNIVDESAPVSLDEGWMVYLWTSRYKLPNDLKKLMNEPCNVSFTSGNAKVNLYKTHDYCISSVDSPRRDGYNKEIQGNKIQTENWDFEYTKAFNESFHGTSFFEPGTCGYQQHMWVCALSGEAFVFVNHPGTLSEASDMRPGYWNGNGVMPAVRQQENMLGAIYCIPDSHPVGLTHVYLPRVKFDEIDAGESAACGWIFLRKGNSYMALWSSTELIPYDNVLFGCELRAYSRNSAYAALCGSATENGDFDSFKAAAKALLPKYDETEKTLILDGDNSYLTWYQSDDKTQFV